MFSWVPLCFLPYNLSISGEEGRTWDEGHVRVCKAEAWADGTVRTVTASPLMPNHFKPHPSTVFTQKQPQQTALAWQDHYNLDASAHVFQGLVISYTHTSLTLRFPLYLIFLRPTFYKVNVFTLHTMLGLPYLFKVRVGLKIDHQGPWESSCSRAEKASERHALDHLNILRKCLKMCTVLKYIYIHAFSRHFYPMCLKNTHSAFCQSQILYYARFI